MRATCRSTPRLCSGGEPNVLFSLCVGASALEQAGGGELTNCSSGNLRGRTKRNPPRSPHRKSLDVPSHAVPTVRRLRAGFVGCAILYSVTLTTKASFGQVRHAEPADRHMVRHRVPWADLIVTSSRGALCGRAASTSVQRVQPYHTNSPASAPPRPTVTTTLPSCAHAS